MGAALAREYSRAHDVVACGRGDVDLAFPEQVASFVRSAAPDFVINCAAATNVDTCEVERGMAETVNSHAPAAIARACVRCGAKMIHISTDYVFSGLARRPYCETDAAEPMSWYGETKRRGETGVLEASEHHAVVRVAWVFGPDRECFIDQALKLALRGEPVRAVADKLSSPTYTLDAAAALAALIDRKVPGGIYHLCNRGACSWRDWAQQTIDAASQLGLPVRTERVEPLKLSDIKAMVAPRPVYTVMSCDRLERLMGAPMRPWQEAVADYVRLLKAMGRFSE